MLLKTLFINFQQLLLSRVLGREIVLSEFRVSVVVCLLGLQFGRYYPVALRIWVPYDWMPGFKYLLHDSPALRSWTGCVTFYALVSVSVK